MNNPLLILIVVLLIVNLVISVATLFKSRDNKSEENYKYVSVKTHPPTPAPSMIEPQFDFNLAGIDPNDPVAMENLRLSREILAQNNLIYQSAQEIASLQSDTPYKDMIYGVRKGKNI